MNNCIYILFFLLLILQENGISQSPYFYNINDEKGLPSNEVYQLKQDSFGFIWIACDAGLYRYDGFNYKAYTNSNQNSKSLSNIIIDKNQYIWSQNFTGQIFKTKAESDSLIIVYDGSHNSRVAPTYTIDNNGNAWIATDSLLIVIDAIGEIVQSFSLEKLGTEKNVWFDIVSSVDGKIYALNYKAELFIIDDITYEIAYHQLDENQNNRLSLFNIDNRIILFTEELPKRHYRISDVTEGNKKELADFAPITASGVNYTITASGNNLMLCSSTGVMVLNKDFSVQKSFPLLFEAYKISYSYLDKEGNYWFTSLQDGIFVVPSLSLQFFNTNNSSLIDNNISTLSVLNDSILYIGNYSGEIYTYNKYSNQMQLIAENKESKYRAVREIVIFDETIYAARGLFSIGIGEKNESISYLNNVRDFVVIKDTIYYTRSDLSGFLSKEEGTWKQNILKQNGGKKVLLDTSRNIVYYACSNGLYRYQNGTFAEIKYKNESIFGSSLWLDSSRLWVGTNNKGILIFEDSVVIDVVNTTNFLTDNNVKAIYKKDNKVFVACRAGLNIIDFIKQESFVVNEFDGLAFKEINEISVWGDWIYLATIKGLVRLPIHFKWENTIAPAIKITTVYINDQPVDKESDIQLNYDDNNLNISFLATAFRSRTQFKYVYRLLNFNDNRIAVNSSTPYVNFSSLPPGEYLFEVAAINEDGIVSASPAQLKINVYAPIWQKWWFYLILSFFSIGIITLVFRARLQFVQRKSEIENKLAASQLTALKAQMNPHFMYNALNSIQALNIKKETKKANYYLSKFSLLMRKVLDASGEEFISVHDEVGWLSLYVELEKLRFGDDFEYQFIIDEKIDSYQMYMPSMILQPFIENAIKHGLLHKKGLKKLTVEFQYTDKLICIITDNGVGRKRVAEIQKRALENHKPFATKATEKRIELLNYKTKDRYSFEIIDLYQQEKPSGTQVIIYIPIIN